MSLKPCQWQVENLSVRFFVEHGKTDSDGDKPRDKTFRNLAHKQLPRLPSKHCSLHKH